MIEIQFLGSFSLIFKGFFLAIPSMVPIAGDLVQIVSLETCDLMKAFKSADGFDLQD